MSEAIPLRRGLWIETPDVIPGYTLVVWNGHNLVFRWEAIEAWRF